MLKQILLFALFCVVANVGFTQEGAPETDATATKTTTDIEMPKGEEAMRVSNYYMNGKDMGPLVMKMEVCQKADTKNFVCTEPVEGKVKKGTRVTSIITFMAPAGSQYDDVMLKVLRDDEEKTSKTIKIGDSIRYRQVHSETAGKAGKYVVRVIYNSNELGSAAFDVE